MKSPTARTTPGITTGVSTRKARIWWPAISFRLVTYASSAASAAPMQAVKRPSSSVLTMAARVDVDMNTSGQLARVRFSPLRGWAHVRAKAAWRHAVRQERRTPDGEQARARVAHKP